MLTALQPLQVSPETPVFTNTTGDPIEPKAFSRHWYDCLRGDRSFLPIIPIIPSRLTSASCTP